MSSTDPAPGRTSGAAMAMLALLTVGFLAPAALGGGQFFFRDTSQNHYPMRSFQVEEIRQGRLPLWNPYLTFGQPSLANPNYGLLRPTSVLYALLPFDAAFRWEVVLLFGVAAVGTAALLGAVGCGPAAQVAGGAAFALSGPVASLGNLQNVLASAAWMPLAVHLLAAAGRGGRRRTAVAGAGALAAVITGGEPMTVAATLPLAAAFALFGGRPPQRRPGAALATVVAAALMALALAAVQWVPAMELLTRAERGAGFGAEEAVRWSMPPARLPEVLVPGFLGDPTRPAADRWWGEGLFPAGLPLLLGVHLGGPVLLLAGAGVLPSPRRRLAVALAAGLAACLLLSLGAYTPLYHLLHWAVPGFALFRYPVKFLLPAALCAACLAGFGVQRVAVASADGIRRGMAVAALLLAVAPAAGAAAILHRGTGAWLMHGVLAAAELPGTGRLALVAPPMVRTLLLAAAMTGACGLLLLAAARGVLRPSLSSACLAGLVAATLWAGGAGLNPTVSPDWYRVEPALLDDIRAAGPLARLARRPRPPGFFLRAEDQDAASAGFLWDRMSLRNATPLLYRLPVGFDRNNDRMHPAASGRAALLAEGETTDRRARLWRLGAVRFVLDYEEPQIPELALAAEVRGESSHPLVLLELADPLPMARVVGRAAPSAGLEESLRRVASGEVDPAATVLLPAGELGEAEAMASGRAEIFQWSPGRVEIRTEEVVGGWLVVAQSHDPDWVAEVDDSPARVLPAYHLFQAVRLPGPGPHRVVLRYRPASVRAGAAISLTALAVGAGLALPWRRPGRAAA